MQPTRKLKLRNIHHWRIALGEEDDPWEIWQKGNFVALGWNELGDLSGLTRREFELRRAAIRPNLPEFTQSSADRLWSFAQHIGEGDRIVVSRSSSQVVGIGTVVGQYYFVADADRSHCLPVEWDDTRPCLVQLPAWRRTLVRLNPAQFAEVLAASPLERAQDALTRQLSEAPVAYTTLRATDPPNPPPNVETRLDGSFQLYQQESAGFDLAACAELIGYDQATIARWLRAIERKGQAIFSGPPGVGKTWIARALARHLVSGGDGMWSLVQFHPAYTYEDFVQGLRPQTAGSRLEFRLQAGRLLHFCAEAEKRQGRCVLILDEINRANLARVFGELLYLLEYREQSIALAGSDQPFRLPANVRVLGTMNTADRSLALVDHALRRRFAFIDLRPNYELLRRFHEGKLSKSNLEALTKLIQRVNRQIGDRHAELGISFFLRPDLAHELAEIWQMEIEPYLEEYFFDQPELVETLRWAQVQREFDL